MGSISRPPSDLSIDMTGFSNERIVILNRLPWIILQNTLWIWIWEIKTFEKISSKKVRIYPAELRTMVQPYYSRWNFFRPRWMSHTTYTLGRKPFILWPLGFKFSYGKCWSRIQWNFPLFIFWISQVKTTDTNEWNQYKYINIRNNTSWGIKIYIC